MNIPYQLKAFLGLGLFLAIISLFLYSSQSPRPLVLTFKDGCEALLKHPDFSPSQFEVPLPGFAPRIDKQPGMFDFSRDRPFQFDQKSDWYSSLSWMEGGLDFQSGSYRPTLMVYGSQIQIELLQEDVSGRYFSGRWQCKDQLFPLAMYVDEDQQVLHFFFSNGIEDFRDPEWDAIISFSWF
ncbi:MAG: hypothetical protein AAF433_01955 [Bacteroidota bacterium]